MLSTIFGSIITNGTLTLEAFLAATAASLLIGFFVAFLYNRITPASRSFLITLTILPAVVQMVIMLVNGNIGAGVAVAGAFGLVRFRSAAGKGQEITSIFLVMAVGLATGMGYIGIAALFAVIISVVYLMLMKSPFGKGADGERVLKVTVPEGLEFEGMFDDLFAKYTARAEMLEVKTSNMGSLYKLHYSILLRPGVSLREMLDEIRTRNGNLEISCGRPDTKTDEL